MEQEKIHGIFDMIGFLVPITETLARGYCLYRFVQPFMVSPVMTNGICSRGDAASVHRGKRIAACGGAAYFLTMLLLYMLRISMDYYVIYGMASLATFLVICRMDKRNYRQKFFLVTTFFSLNILAASMAEILYDFLYYSALETDFMQRHEQMAVSLYVIMCIFDLVMEIVFTVIGTWQVVRIYVDKGREMEKKEVVLLALPSLMGVIGYEIMRYYRMFYALEIGELERTYDSLMLLYCAISSLTIIVVIMLYQDIRAKQEENQQAKILGAQISSLRQHMEQVEGLYQNIRSIKHDMTNHVLTLEGLYEGNQAEEARAYSNCLKAELAQMTGEWETGNPVTNVILQEFAKEAGKRGISFHSEFYYPVDSNIDAFDISVILNNALQNAMENTGRGERISVISYRRNNACIIEICNSFTGDLQWNTQSGLPVTTKEKAEGHGYGLPNIRRVAGKYAGDIDIALRDGQFCLCILLMME